MLRAHRLRDCSRDGPRPGFAELRLVRRSECPTTGQHTSSPENQPDRNCSELSTPKGLQLSIDRESKDDASRAPVSMWPTAWVGTSDRRIVDASGRPECPRIG